MLALLAVLLLSGCAGYRLGPTNGVVAREKSVDIRPFSNKTLEPRLTDAVAMELRRRLQRDGTYTLATHQDDGDIVLTGVILRYYRHELTFEPRDTLTVRDYRVSLTAEVTAQDRATGKVLFSQPITGYTIIRVGRDITNSERQALPLLAEDLARHVVDLLADGSW